MGILFFNSSVDTKQVTIWIWLTQTHVSAFRFYIFVSCLLLFAFCTHSDHRSLHTTSTVGVFDSSSAQCTLTRTQKLTHTHRTNEWRVCAFCFFSVGIARYIWRQRHIDEETTRRQTLRFVRRHSALHDRWARVACGACRHRVRLCVCGSSRRWKEKEIAKTVVYGLTRGCDKDAHRMCSSNELNESIGIERFRIDVFVCGMCAQ